MYDPNALLSILRKERGSRARLVLHLLSEDGPDRRELPIDEPDTTIEGPPNIEVIEGWGRPSSEAKPWPRLSIKAGWFTIGVMIGVILMALWQWW